MYKNKSNNIRLELKEPPRTERLAATVENVRRSCHEVVNSPDCMVKIDENRLNSFVDNLDMAEVKRSSHFMDIPVEFQNLHAEVNFHINLHLFNFGHGFRHPLHNVCGCGAWQTMKRGIISLHLNCSNGFIDANSLLNLTEESVNEHFQFPSQSQNPSPDAEKISFLRDMILQVAISTGKRLIDLGYHSFAEFIFNHPSPSETDDSLPTAMGLVENLADNFPPFDDRRVLSGGKEVLFLKKAQIAVAEIYQRLGNSLSDQISFDNIKQFTVVCDNVLPCVMRSLGILKIDPELEIKIDKKQFLPAGNEEAQLRASTVTAAEIILQKGDGAFWSKELGDFLWTLGKDPEFRKVERHATIDTCFY